MAAQTNADFVRTFALTKKSDGTPFNLTGLVLKMQLKNRRGAVAALECSTANGRLISLLPTNGNVTLTIPYNVIDTIAPANYSYDVVSIVSSTSRVLLWRGVLPIAPGITDDGTQFLPGQSSVIDDISIVVDDDSPISVEINDLDFADALAAMQALVAEAEAAAAAAEAARDAADTDLAGCEVIAAATASDREECDAAVISTTNAETQTGLYLAAAQALEAEHLFKTSGDSGIAGLADGTPYLIQGASGGDIYASLWRRKTAGPADDDQGLSVPSYAALVATLAAQEQETFALGFADSNIDSIITAARLDKTTGQFIGADCAGFADDAVSYTAGPKGPVRNVARGAPAIVRVAGGSFVAPAARVERGSESIDCRAQILFSAEPAIQTLTETSAVEYDKEHLVPTAKYVLSITSVTRIADSVLAVPNVDYIAHSPNRSGAIFGINNIAPYNAANGSPVSVVYQGQMVRKEIISTDPYGRYTITPGPEVWKAPSMHMPTIPDGDVAVFECYRYPGFIDLMPVHRYRKGVLRGAEQSYDARMQRNKQQLSGLRTALIRGQKVAFVGIGDSRLQLGGSFTPDIETAITTLPNGSRDTVGYYSTYDTGTRALIQQYSGWGDGRTDHVREGLIWSPIKQLYKIFAPTIDAVTPGLSNSLIGWGDPFGSAAANPISYRNWGIAGTDSTDQLKTDNGPPVTHRACMLYPDHLNAYLADIDAMIAAGVHVCVCIAMGMNELGLSFTDDNFMTLIGLLRAHNVPSIYVQPPCRRSPFFSAAYDAWAYTCFQIGKVAEDADVALIPVYELFRNGNTASFGFSERELAEATEANHDGLREQNAQGQLVVDSIV